MRYHDRRRGFPGILIGVIILLIASSFFFHLFFPFYWGAPYTWHPFFFFGGFWIIKVVLLVALISFIGRRFFWGHRRWSHEGYGHRGGFGYRDGYAHGGGCGDSSQYTDEPRANQFQGFKQYRHGKAPFERAGNRTSADFIELASGFGSTEKKMASKNFQGGDVTTVMGQLVLDLRDADINGTVHLKITQIKGVTTILVPKDWDVRAGVGTVFATYQDGEAEKSAIDPGKVLIIDGTCVMGDIEVRTK